VLKDHVLQIFNREEEKEEVRLEAAYGSDNAVDKDTKRSVTGFVIFIMGAQFHGDQKGRGMRLYQIMDMIW
jgi:hypothetical protein